MAILFVDSLTEKRSKFVQIFVKILEILFLSTGLITTLVMVKRAAILPNSCKFVFSSLVGFWSSVRCCLSSYFFVCIAIHVIVVLIVASSAFKRHDNHNGDDHEITVNVDQRVIQVAESLPPAAPPPSRQAEAAEEIKKASSEEKKVTPDHPPPPPPLSGEEEEDTMEATWKAITGGGKEKTRKENLKKSETRRRRRCVATVRRVDSEEVVPTTPKWKELRKAETFNDAVSVTRRGGLVRDPSMSLEEFNLQVEAFIKNFNDNMRLQRQESKKRFFDMIKESRRF